MRRSRLLWAVAGAWLAGLSGLGLAAGTDDEVKERLKNDPFMMPYYTGNVFPKPQSVTYEDRFLPVNKAAIVVGKDVKNADALTKLLIERISRYGGSAEVVASPGPGHDSVISLGDTPIAAQVANLPKVPEKEQGYILCCGKAGGKDVAVLKGTDHLGLVWAIGSFTQLVQRQPGKTVVRAASISDYPRMKYRGYLHGNIDGFSENCTAAQSQLYNVTFKVNMPIYKHLCRNYYSMKHPKTPGEWRDSSKYPTEAKNIKDIGALLTPLGITWYAGFHPLVGPEDQKLHGSPENIEALAQIARPVIEAGGRYYLQFDDYRFDLHPYDKQKFGTAREADIFIFNSLMEKLKKDFPDTRMLYCPPFYWNRSYRDYGKVESLDEYVDAVGKRLTKDVDVQWTGNWVKSGSVTKEHVDWFSRRIQRKPFYWQNCCLTYHAWWYHYVADALPDMKKNYYDGFMDDVIVFAYNSTFPNDYAINAQVAGYFWNPTDFDAAGNAREVAGKLCGPETWAALSEICKHLSWADALNGWPPHKRDDDKAARWFDSFQRHLEGAEKAFEQVSALSPAAIASWTGLKGQIGAHRGHYQSVEKNPALEPLRAAAILRGKQVQWAVKEADCDPDEDAFYGAGDLKGGTAGEVADDAGGKRMAVSVSPKATCSVEYGVSAEDLPKDRTLTVSALAGDASGTPVKVSVNGKDVSAGRASFAKGKWSQCSFPIPAGALREKANTIIMLNDSGAPLAVSYIFVKLSATPSPKNGAAAEKKQEPKGK